MSKELIEIAKKPILAFNKKDWEGVRAAVTDSFTYDEVANHRRLQGIDNVIEVWKGWGAAFPDSKATIHNAHVSGKKVVLELTWRGTNDGPMHTPQGEIPPTHKKMEMRGCVVCSVEGDRVSEQTQYFDMATMMSQLGLA